LHWNTTVSSKACNLASLTGAPLTNVQTEQSAATN
jgi:hypothetical protein